MGRFIRTLLIGMVQLLALIREPPFRLHHTGSHGAGLLRALLSSHFPGIPIMFGASLLKLVKYFVAGNATGPQIFYFGPGNADRLWSPSTPSSSDELCAQA